MNKVEVAKARASGSWIQCVTADSRGPIKVRLRLRELQKLAPTTLDDKTVAKLRKTCNLDDADIWVLSLDVLNWTKRQTDHNWFRALVLVDHDGFQFHHLHSYDLSESSFGQAVGLSRFSSIDFAPKIKESGALAFLLPREEGATYSVSLADHSYASPTDEISELSD